MSSLTTETREVWTIILYPMSGGEFEIAEYDYECEEAAFTRAQEELSEYIAKTGCHAYCKLERRVVPIYK